MAIHYRAPIEIEKLFAANQIVARALDMAEELILPGVRTRDLDRAVEEFILDSGARPSFKGYRGFPAASCISVNEEIVHGIPGSRRLADGDIVGVDIGVELNGYYGDAARSWPVGEVSDEAERLLEVTRGALEAGIEAMKVDARLSDISAAIQTLVEDAGYSVVRSFVGHGIGTSPHEDPQVPNFGRPGRGPILRSGMVLAIEPMVNVGRSDTRVLDDGWTAVTLDGSLSAHFEHSVALTESGARVLSELDGSL